MTDQFEPYSNYKDTRYVPECDEQIPVISPLGKGIPGDSYRIGVQSDSAAETHLFGQIYDEATKQWILPPEWISENINGGELQYRYNKNTETNPRSFTITFIYSRPGRKEWTWTTPAIPYIWDSNNGEDPDVVPIIDSISKVSGISVNGVRNILNGIPNNTEMNSIKNFIDANVLSLQLQINSLVQGVLTPGCVQTVHLAPEAVTNDKILDGAISGLKYADNSIKTSKLVDRQINSAKLALQAVQTENIKDKSVDFTKMICPFPVGSIYLSTLSTNPSSIYPGTSWSAYAQGRVLVGVGTGTGDDGSNLTVAPNAPFGEYKHKLTIAEMAKHTHVQDPHTHSIRYTEDGTASGAGSRMSTSGTNNSGAINDATATNHTAGSDTAHNNIQPSIGVYMFTRIS